MCLGQRRNQLQFRQILIIYYCHYYLILMIPKTASMFAVLIALLFLERLIHEKIITAHETKKTITQIMPKLTIREL